MNKPLWWIFAAVLIVAGTAYLFVIPREPAPTPSVPVVENTSTANGVMPTVTTIVATDTTETNLTATNVSNPKNETINGTAYLPPAADGEGMAVRYTEVVDGTTYQPWQELANQISSSTVITNNDQQPIPFDRISAGDHLLVHLSIGVCITGVPGGPSGCQMTIFSIQDLSL